LSQNSTSSRRRSTGSASKPARGAAPIREAPAPLLPAGSPLTRVRRSPIHGRGLFAASAIPKGTRLGRYEGEVTDRDGCYVLWVENEARDGVYGVRGRNSLRFVNHARLNGRPFL